MFDLQPATDALTHIVLGVSDDQLSAATPCPDTSVADLLDHVDGLCLAFTAAATKTPPAGGSQGPSADGSRLGPDWRTRIPARLYELAAAWRDDSAWTGMVAVGGVEMPGDVTGAVAVNEVIVHGWDLAHATGQDFTSRPDMVQAALGFVQPSVASNPEGIPGLFGPAVPPPDGATPLERLVALTGRDPAWRAP